MGQIVASYDLMPENTDVDLGGVIEAVPSVIPNGVKVLESKIEPVAFGLKKVNVGFIIDDESDSIGEDLEKALASIPGIENVECISSTVY
ncbi:MAG: elongation factor 1-beta [Candidatus Methanoplasma sp.]|jgi:elongation factor 1-beta|nr:elongation factor 1-beta [Candidatus Methanoplasma sp.]